MIAAAEQAASRPGAYVGDFSGDGPSVAQVVLTEMAIPNDDKSRLRWLIELGWLFGPWADVDAWVTGPEAANG